MDIRILFFILWMTFMETTEAQKDTLIYIGDPMCSWCYGFGPELEKLVEKNPQLVLKIVTGGLRADGTEKFSELGGFLKSHWQEIHHRTGLPFKYDILQNQELYYNTEPACRAVISVRILKPAIEMAYFRALQNSFYADNMNPISTQTFVQLAKEFKIDAELYLKTFQSDKAKQWTRDDFKMAKNLGVRGFPSLLFKNKNGTTQIISNGFANFSTLQAKLAEIIKSN